MKSTSLRSKVILHLAKFSYIDIHDRYGAPLDITQDGIAMALGITRSYTSLVLGRMEETNTVEHATAIIKASTTNAPRKIYQLTNQGKIEYRDLMNQIKEEGLTVDGILAADANHLSTSELLALPEGTRDMLGFLCVMESRIMKDDMPVDIPSVIPFDIHGMAFIKDDTRKRFLTASGEEAVRRYHSMAADWCTDHSVDPDERIRHLVSSGRHREAVRSVVSDRFRLMEESDSRMVPTLVPLCTVGCNPLLAETVIRMSLENGMPDRAESVLRSCPGMDPCLKDALSAAIELEKGNESSALDMALDCYCGDGITGLVLGRCMMANGRFEEAEVYLRKARESMIDDGFVFDLEKVLALEAETAVSMGKDEQARELVSMTEDMMKRKSTAAALDRIRKVLGPPACSEDGVCLQVV